MTQDARAFYTAGYSVSDPAEAERLGRWRALGARTKAAHAFALCGREGLVPTTLVEIGCGDGALLWELSRLAAVVDGFELSPTAIELACSRRIPGARRLEAYDGVRVPAGDGAYDLAVLSHVLEHVGEPARLLAEAARVGRHVLVEVPLEDNRSARRPAKRAEADRIGHIQRFARADVEALLTGAGLRLVADLADPLPRAHHVFFATSPRHHTTATARWAARTAAWRLAPRTAERAFTVHYAALASRA